MRTPLPATKLTAVLYRIARAAKSFAGRCRGVLVVKHLRQLVALSFGLWTVSLVALPFGASTAYAAPGDYCFISDTKQPGEEDLEGFCLPTNPPDGFDCGDGLSYNQDAQYCVANNEQCSISGGGSGLYQGGLCEALPEPPAPTNPPALSGFQSNPDAGALPGGELQPMCVNASPFIGGGMFIVSGTVLCYDAAGRPTGIHAYTDDGEGQSGWNLIDPNRPKWDSITLRDLYASDDISAQGVISSYGGAQFYSPNGFTGFQLTDYRIYLRAADEDGNVASMLTTPGNIAMLATDGTATSGMNIEANGVSVSAYDGTATSGLSVKGDKVTLSTNDGATSSGLTMQGDSVSIVAADGEGGVSAFAVNGNTGIDVAGFADTVGPGVGIAGRVGDDSTASVGVWITGDGKGVNAAPTSGPAGWADTLLSSKNFTLDNGLGSGVIVNDYGINIRSAAVGNSYNFFGSGAENAVGSVVNNVIGDGGLGTVNNYIGRTGDVGTVVTNEIGTAVGGGSSINRIGNTNALTTFSATAGTSSVTVIQGALDMVTGQGGSILPAATQQVSGGTATSMLAIASRHAVVDANGSVSMANGPAAEASTASYIVNGYGNTNAVVITERSAVLSGGEQTPTSLTMTDTGAHFSNASTGAPVAISGVADGQGAFDATNVRQLHSGLASVVALTGLPSPAFGKRNSFGIAFGQHGTGSAVALGGQAMFSDDFTVKYGASVSHASGRIDSSLSLGAGLSW